MLRLACPLEFPNRADGLKPLQQTYGFEFAIGSVAAMEPGAIYTAFRQGFDVAVVFAIKGRISESDLIILRDDRGFFPSYLLTPVVRQTTLDQHPEIKPVLEKLSAELDNDTIAALNAAWRPQPALKTGGWFRHGACDVAPPQDQGPACAASAPQALGPATSRGLRGGCAYCHHVP